MAIDVHNLWLEEQKYLAKVETKEPALLVRENPIDPDQILERIGVFGLPQERPEGYIKFMPQDFIVEEISQEGELVPIEPEKTEPDPSEDERTLWVKLIKVNLATLDAIEHLAKTTGIDRNTIGYAGIKDAVAVTAQKLSLRGISWQDVGTVKIPNLHLEPLEYGKGALQVGHLKGNRFTILIRMREGVDKDWLQEEVQRVGEQGFWNYYGPQRFGNRLLSHKWGWFLAKGDTDGLLKSFLTEAGPFDLPLFKKYRNQLASIYGDWAEMERIMSYLPYSFRYEREVLGSLINDPKKTRNALLKIREQVRLWGYAYASYCTNRLLARASETGMKLKDEVPLLLSDRAEDVALYHDFLREDEVQDLQKNLSVFGGLFNFTRRTIETKTLPKIHTFKEINDGVIFSFDLGKGSYATALLMQLVKMYEGEPVPDWVSDTEIDQKQIIGTGSIDVVRPYLGEFLRK